MPSIVIAAHNEEQLLGSTLTALLADEHSPSLEVIVSANGCTDRTVTVARDAGVIVVERPEPGKAGALNAGDAVAATFPRVYLDADIIVPPGGLGKVFSLFCERPGRIPPLAVVPARRVNTAGRPWLVRAYFAINEQLPAFRDGLFGRGFIALSREGRSRFEQFPLMIADDLFLDSQYSSSEKAQANDVVVVVEAPHTARDLLKRLVRVRRGNAEMRRAAADHSVTAEVRRSDRWAWLRDVVANDPRMILSAIPYLGVTILAALLARGPARSENWGRDESTRLRAVEGDR